MNRNEFFSAISRSAVVAGIALMLLGSPFTTAVALNIADCTGLVFSTEEDFRTGVTPPDGNDIISDGDLISHNFPGPGAKVCARNSDLLAVFKVRMDLGLDAVDIILPEKESVVFSTSLDDPQGRFTAGDLVATNGAVVPNQVLLARFPLLEPKQDLGLDAVHLTGKSDAVHALLMAIAGAPDDKDAVERRPQNARLDEPERLFALLKEYGVDILFSTEGTGLTREGVAFLDGDLLSALSGTIVARNADWLPMLPAGLPDRGVDYGLDAVTPAVDPIEQRGVAIWLFSTEIVSLDRPLTFTDGDLLQAGAGVFWRNIDLIGSLEPRASDLGLDALDLAYRPDCGYPEIREIGSIDVGLIDNLGYAYKQDGISPDPTVYDSPFGRWISVRGNLPDADCLDITQYEYRVEYKQGAGPWIPITTPSVPPDPPKWKVNASAVCGLPVWVPYESDANGWIPLVDYWQGKRCKAAHALAMWQTKEGMDGPYRLRLSYQPIGGGPLVMSAEEPVLVDNTPPAGELTLTDSTGTLPLANQCEVEGSTSVPTIIGIKGQIEDEHFRRYILQWAGADQTTWNLIDLINPAGYRYYDGGYPHLDEKGTQPLATDVTLGTFNLTQEYNAQQGSDPIACGYTVRLYLYDRTIRGSFTDPEHNQYSENLLPLGLQSQFIRTFCYTPAASE